MTAHAITVTHPDGPDGPTCTVKCTCGWTHSQPAAEKDYGAHKAVQATADEHTRTARASR